MRLLTLIALALAMAGLVVVATHAQTVNVEATVQQATTIVLNILRQILDVLVGFIGDVLDEIVRAAKSFFGSK